MAVQRSSGEQPHRAPDDVPKAEQPEESLTPRIYVVNVDGRAGGEPRAAWVDADQDPEELRQAIADAVGDSPEHWRVHDSEGFGSLALSQTAPLETISAVALGIAEYNGAFAAYASWAGDDEEALRAFSGRYRGHWPSLEAYARDVADDLGWHEALEELPVAMQPYVVIDYDRLARFLNSSLNIVKADGGVYVFSDR